MFKSFVGVLERRSVGDFIQAQADIHLPSMDCEFVRAPLQANSSGCWVPHCHDRTIVTPAGSKSLTGQRGVLSSGYEMYIPWCSLGSLVPPDASVSDLGISDWDIPGNRPRSVVVGCCATLTGAASLGRRKLPLA